MWRDQSSHGQSTSAAKQLALHRKRSGVARASLTKLNMKLADLEASRNPDTLIIAQSLDARLKTLDTEFRTHYLFMVDLIDNATTLDAEQKTPDTHDDNIGQLSVRIYKLISAATTSPKTDPKRVSSKRLAILREKLNSTAESMRSTTDDVDGICKLQQHQEEMMEFKKELKEVQACLLEIDLEEGDPFIEA